MELLLNLLWLTLALPAVWMWRHQSVCSKDCGRFHQIRPIVLFGCILMLLFPVISATDDLHAMRQEIEESGSSKRVVKQAVADKSLTHLSSAGALPAIIFPGFDGNDQVCGKVLIAAVRLPEQESHGKTSSRAPPFSRLEVRVRFAA
jgi:hypothetical protein